MIRFILIDASLLIYKMLRKLNLVGVVILITLITNFQKLYAEGTKQIRPNSGDHGYLILDSRWSPFAMYNSPAESRLMISVCNPGEKVYLGFNQPDGDVKFRIKDINGNIVFNETNVPTSGAGYITNHARALAGPSAIVGGTGYNALEFTPPAVGEYFIEFTHNASRREFDLFDITVASSTNQAVNGRIWSKAWMFSTKWFTNVFQGKMFIYADDGIVTSIDFNGMEPFVFVLSANKSGTQNTGNSIADRQSTQGRRTYPQYKIFLTAPDETCFPTGTFGNLTKPVTITGCGQKRCINVTVDKAGDVEVLLDLTLPVGFQPNTRDRILPATVQPGDNCIEWDSKDGQGNLMRAGERVPLELNYFNGLTHMPLFDVEGNRNGYIVDLIKPSGSRPRLFWDDTRIGPSAPPNNLNLSGCSNVAGCHTWQWAGSDNAATDYGNTNTINTWWYANIIKADADYVIQDVVVDANVTNPPQAPNDTTVCASVASVQLFGGVFGANGGRWSGGTNNFSPSPTTLAAVYTPSQAEKNLGRVKLTLTSNSVDDCPPVSDTMRIFFTPTPSVNPGNTQTLCKNVPNINLVGSVNNASGAIWSGGAGRFTPDNTSLNTTYTPTDAEKNGTLQLLLTSTGNSVCAPVSAPLAINFIDGPTVSLSKDTTACANSPSINLRPTLTVATQGVWTGGNGVFSPNRNTANIIYTATSQEIQAGSVNLSFSTTDNGNCLAGVGNITIRFTNGPTVNAGLDRSICVNNPNIALLGSIQGAASGRWVGGLGQFAPNRNSLAATYTPNQTELDAGKVILVLESVGGNCGNAKDTVTYTFTPAPTVKAGADRTVCENNASANITATFTGANGVQWLNGLGAFVPNRNTANIIYTPSANELSNKIAALVVTTTGNGNCNPAFDTVLVLFAPAPTVEVKSTKALACSNNPEFDLEAITTNTQQGVWSGGAGDILPSADSSKIKYIATAEEVSSGLVKLVYTAQKGGCLNVIDTINLSFFKAPTIDAGPNLNICINNPLATISGSISPSTPIKWTGGNGTFTNSNSLNTSYTANANELNNKVKLLISSVPNNSCKPVKDSLEISFTPAPTLNAGPDQTVCNNNPIISLNATINAQSTGVTWSGGTGNFSPQTTLLNPTYSPSNNDLLNNTVTLKATTTGNGNCSPVSDELKITFREGPKANAGADIKVCADNAIAQLNGSVTIATGGVWSGGKGTFSPNINALNARYNPTLEEINAGKVTLTLTTTGNGDCNPHSDEVLIEILSAPSANAGSDQTVCEQSNLIQLNGTIKNSVAGQWKTLGTGTFSPNSNSLTATYQPSAADITAQEVKLVLSTSGNDLCSVYTDTMLISFTVTPKINAGPDQTICTNDLPILLKANGSAGRWVNGNGTFLPNRNTLNAIYNPTTAEINSGTITLTFTTNPQGSCPSVSDQVIFTIPQGPIANAGIDRTICANQKTVNLSGTVSNTTGGFWNTNGTGSFNQPKNQLQTIYQISDADAKMGKVEFILSTTGNNLCSSDTDLVVINITPEVIVEAGPDQSVCADINQIPISGASANTAVLWTSTGTGSFVPNNNTLNVNYVPSAADTTNGAVTLTLSANATANCPAVNDTKILIITDAPKANAGSDINICADSSFVDLAGQVSVAKSAIWKSRGTGTFSPNAIGLNVKYFPSALDTTNGKVTLIMTTDGNGTCNAVSDSLVLNIAPQPIINLGNDIEVCADESQINLSAQFANAQGISWSSNGNGTYIPNNLSAITAYNLTNQDKSSGMLVFTATTTGNNLCKAVQDKLIVNIKPAITVQVGGNQTVCADVNGVKLNGIVTIASGGVWTSSGTGKFLPDSSVLNATYQPSNQDTTNKNIALTLTTTGNGICKAKSAVTNITILPAPLVNAGSNFTVCADTAAVNLNGKVFNAQGGAWTTNGTGVFFPNHKTLNASYVPSANDKKNSKVILTLLTTGVGTCVPVLDSVEINIIDSPELKVGSDTTLCETSTQLQLKGVVTNGNNGRWISSGTGTFQPNNLVPNPIYVLSNADKKAGLVQFNFEAEGNGVCKAVNINQKLRITPLPKVDAGTDKNICANTNEITLTAQTSNNLNSKWMTTATGVFVSSVDSLNAIFKLSTSDKANNKISFVNTATGKDGCASATDTVNILITQIPSISVGTDKQVCADASAVDITSIVTNSTGVSWKSEGNGSFSPSNLSTQGKYVFGNGETNQSTVRLTATTTGNSICPPASDDLIITISPKPTLEVGINQTICADAEFVDVKALLTVSKGVKWNTSGNGVFAPADSLVNTSYFPSASDKLLGTITIEAISTNNGLCLPVSDNLTITIVPSPSLDAGPTQTVCPDVTSMPLNPTLAVATGIRWSTEGTGTFSPNNTNTFANYVPSAQDKANGSVLLKAITTGNGLCNSVADDIQIVFNTVAPINAGQDVAVCNTDAFIQLDGKGTTGTWSGGAGSFVPNASTLNAQYIPTASEISSGKVNLTITSNTTGTCPPSSDAVEFTFNQGPTVNAGNDVITCESSNNISLNGVVNIASGGLWSSSGSGTFTNASVLNTIYSLSSSDKNNGVVKLTLTSTGNGLCKPVKDELEIQIISKPISNAGEDITVCADVNTINVSGKVEKNSSFVWSSIPSGGVFGANTLTTTFAPSSADKNNGSVKLVLLANAVSPCAGMTDTMTVFINPLPNITLNPNMLVCADTNSVKLNAVLSNASGINWVSNGTGVFSPQNALNTTYNLSSDDKKNAKITITATTTGNGLCNAQNKNVEIDIQPLPVVNAGGDFETCADVLSVALKATFDKASGVIWKNKFGNNFTPNPNSSNTNYTITQDEIKLGITTFEVATTGNGICKPITDYINVTIRQTPNAIVNAGFDQILCADKKSIELIGQIKNAAGGEWKTTGNGKFSPNNTNLENAYIPTANDTAARKVSIILTTTENGVCKPASDTMLVTLVPTPKVNAGQPQTICADSTSVLLKGTIANTKGASWSSSGQGFFSSSNAILNPSYSIAATDITIGRVGFTLTTSNDEICEPVSASVILTITPKPSLKLPDDLDICANIGLVPLSADRTIARGIIWRSQNGGTFEPNAQSLQTNYVPSIEDITLGAAKITAVTTGNGTCKPVIEDVIIKFTPNPFVNAGPDITVCEDSAKISLNAIVGNNASVLWKTLGTGTFTDANSINAIYSPSKQDAKAGKVSLVVTALGNLDCGSVSDTLHITLQPLPSLNLQPPKICPDAKGAQLSVTFDNANSGFWSSKGDGVFSPNRFAFDAIYFPSQNEIVAGKTSLSFTAISGGLCKPLSNDIDLITTPAPKANAGPDQTICRGSSANLFALPQPNQSYRWQNLNGVLIANNQLTQVTVSNNSKFVLVASTPDGCVSNDTVQIDVIDPPTFDMDDHFCMSDTLKIDSKPNNLPPVNGLFQWALNNRNIENETKPVIFPADAGKYRIIYSFEKCTVNDSTKVTSPPVLITLNKFACANETVSLETSKISNAQYTWFRNNTNIGATNPLVTNTILDTNFYRVRIVDLLGCATLDSARIIGIPKPEFNISNITACLNDPIVLKAKPTNYPNVNLYKHSYTWTKDNAPLQVITDSLNVTSTGMYIAKVTVEVCTKIDTSKVLLNPLPLPVKARVAEFCGESDKTVVIDANNGQTSIKYLWEQSKNITQKDTVNKEGFYVVMLSNNFNCKLRDSIKVMDNCPPVIYVPNAITPSANNQDAAFKVFGRNFTNFEILVFSRWGEVIFKTNDRNETWDGTYRGEPMPIGVYPYLINYEGDSEKYKGPYKTEGTITIVR